MSAYLLIVFLLLFVVSLIYTLVMPAIVSDVQAVGSGF
jgi:hypothetical protein